jgi:hypothetical protein
MSGCMGCHFAAPSKVSKVNCLVSKVLLLGAQLTRGRRLASSVNCLLNLESLGALPEPQGQPQA